MPDWIAVIVLGIIEGITEFLPVSSTGHLVVAEHWLKPRTELFNVVIQCGAVFAVLLVFTRRLKQMFQEWRAPATRDYVGKLAVAFFLTASVGLVLKKLGLKLSDNAAVVATTTLVGGVLILAVERWLRGRQLSDQITWPIAFAVGGAQVVAAVFPGTSRSGATILLALAFGLARPMATEFSFLLGIPTLLAAGGYEIFSAWRHGEMANENWSMVLLGTLIAAATAFIAVKWLLRYVQTHTFVAFGWYRIALGIVIWLLLRA